MPDSAIRTPSHAERARTLAARAPDGCLATMSVAPEGFPYASLVLFALHDGDPIFLVSELATHTTHLRASSRCSLLIKEAAPDDPLALGRVTLVGTAAPSTADEVQGAFLARHPDAARYAGFGDFGFWRMSVAAVRYIGGFGRMSWVAPAEWYAATPDPLVDAAAGIVAHMNDDHRDALPLYCRAFGGLDAVEDATMTGVDRYGFELSAGTPEGPRPVRVGFSEPVTTANDVRRELIVLLKQARADLPSSG